MAESPGWEVAWARDVTDALALPLAAFDAVVLDGEDVNKALEAVRRLRSAAESGRPPLLVRLFAKEEEARHLLAAGASCVVPHAHASEGDDRETAVFDALTALIAHHGSERRQGTSTTADRRRPRGGPAPGVVWQSPRMRSVFDLLQRAMRSQATVLLAGETGTGKELLARSIHAGGRRCDAPFVAVNCAAFPEPLLESELFGYVKGAFTGADRPKKGLFEAAHGGTLFLDEVGETSPALQAKLLRVLQEREVRPVGGARTHPIDVRLVAATNRDLRAEVAHGRLREDLYYRLAVFPISVPPLRMRREDILPLAAHFLEQHGAREEKPGCSLAGESADLLLAHPWPGNVRELENEMQRALALVEAGQTITPAELSEGVRNALEPVAAAARRGESLRDTMARIEAWLVRRALAAHAGHRSATARTLGLTREGLYKKMKRYGIE